MTKKKNGGKDFCQPQMQIFRKFPPASRMHLESRATCNSRVDMRRKGAVPRLREIRAGQSFVFFYVVLLTVTVENHMTVIFLSPQDNMERFIRDAEICIGTVIGENSNLVSVTMGQSIGHKALCIYMLCDAGIACYRVAAKRLTQSKWVMVPYRRLI